MSGKAPKLVATSTLFRSVKIKRLRTVFAPRNAWLFIVLSPSARLNASRRKKQGIHKIKAGLIHVWAELRIRVTKVLRARPQFCGQMQNKFYEALSRVDDGVRSNTSPVEITSQVTAKIGCAKEFPAFRALPDWWG